MNEPGFLDLAQHTQHMAGRPRDDKTLSQGLPVLCPDLLPRVLLVKIDGDCPTDLPVDLSFGHTTVVALSR